MDRVYYSFNILNGGKFHLLRKVETLYFYEQDGIYYEFFTGQCLGAKSAVNGPGYEYVGFDEFGKRIPITGFSDRSHAARLSAGEFADEVRPYMRSRKKQKKAVEALLDQWRQERVREKALQSAEAQAEARKKIQSEQNARWLENLLNNRR